MQLIAWWTRRQRVLGSLDAILHAHHRQSMEQHQMSLDLSKLLDAQRRLTTAAEALVQVITAQNLKIAALTTAADSGPKDQAAVDQATADLVAAADKTASAVPPSTAPAP